MTQNGDPNLDEQLRRDPEFIGMIQDRAVAEQAYLMFPNREWRHRDGRRQMLSWRFAGEMVAEARGQGENYGDYYLAFCWDGFAADPAVETALRVLFARLGWEEVLTSDDEE